MAKMRSCSDSSVHRGANDDTYSKLRRSTCNISTATRHRWRNAIARARSLRCATLTVLLLCVASLLLLLSTPSATLGALNQRFRHTPIDTPHNSTAALLDGRPIAKPLPQVYPNGTANIHRCDLPSLRYQCDLDSSVGCRAYPQLFPTRELLRNWPPDAPTKQPVHIYASICRFNVSNPYELELAHVFHQMEVPFISYGIPALDAAATRWTDEYLTAQLQPLERYKVHIANTSHFLYYSKSNALAHEPPTYASAWWTYEEFVAAVATATKAPTGAFYYLMLKAHDIATRAAFVLDDLAFLDPARSNPSSYGNLFIRDAADARARGMRCRFGMPGIVTDGHFDVGLNTIAMVRGAKRYILSPPSVCACLELATTGASARHTTLNWSDVAALSPSAAACPATEVVVAAGDVLYIPSFWYHHIVSLDASVQCNVRSGTIRRPDVQSYLTQCGFS